MSIAEADPERTEPHLIADVVIEAVWDAARYGAPSALEYVQAAVLTKAVFMLSWALAGRSWNYGHHYEAIRLLLGEMYAIGLPGTLATVSHPGHGHSREGRLARGRAAAARGRRTKTFS